jgi:hypothetical protein
MWPLGHSLGVVLRRLHEDREPDPIGLLTPTDSPQRSAVHPRLAVHPNPVVQQRSVAHPSSACHRNSIGFPMRVVHPNPSYFLRRRCLGRSPNRPGWADGPDVHRGYAAVGRPSSVPRRHRAKRRRRRGEAGRSRYEHRPIALLARLTCPFLRRRPSSAAPTRRDDQAGGNQQAFW